MSDVDPPPHEDEYPFAAQVPRMAKLVREAFEDGSALSRGKLLKLFRSTMFVDTWKESIKDACESNPELTREEVVKDVREQHMEFYDRVADAAGLEDLDRRSYVNSARRGFDVAASGGEGTRIPVTPVEADPVLHAEKAVELRAAFDGDPAGRPEFLDGLYRDIVRLVSASRVEYANDAIRYEVYLQSFKAGLLRLAVDAKLSDPEAEVYTATVRRAFDDAEQD